MALDLPNTAQIFQEREQLHQVCSAVVFVFFSFRPSLAAPQGGSVCFAQPSAENGRGWEEVAALGLHKLLAPKLDLYLIEAGCNYSLVSVQLFLKM